MAKIKCITFDKNAQGTLPEHIKEKMKADREKARAGSADGGSEKLLMIIQSLRDADVFIRHIFMRGGCYRFHLFLKTMYPNAVPYIHINGDHIATMIFDSLFDIDGIIEPKYRHLYSSLTDKDIHTVRGWRFSKTQVLMLMECPHCEEPIIYDDYKDMIELVEPE